MPFPAQTFATLQDLFNYMNTFFVPNGNEEIDGEIGNNILNGLGMFIPAYSVNAGRADIKSGGGAVTLSKPMNIIIGTVPSSLTWADNVQFEYYITNATASNIPLLSGTVYYDQYLTQQHLIPARTTIHLAKATNGNWIFVGNLGGGGGGGLPPQTGNDGKGLVTNGTSAEWQYTMDIELFNSDFEPDGKTCISPKIEGLTNFLVWCVNINNYLNKWDSPPEFMIPAAGELFITAPWFDINADSWIFILKPQSAP